VEDIYDNSIQIFPNPISNQLIVSFNGQVPEHITIINPIGEALLLCKWDEVHPSMSFDFTSYPAGVYILTWTITGRMGSRRIVKMN
jgi:hypothetical protein